MVLLMALQGYCKSYDTASTLWHTKAATPDIYDVFVCYMQLETQPYIVLVYFKHH